MYHTVRKVLADFAVCDVWRYCKAFWDVIFLKIEGNGWKFRHILYTVQLSNSVISWIFEQCREDVRRFFAMTNWLKVLFPRPFPRKYLYKLTVLLANLLAEIRFFFYKSVFIWKDVKEITEQEGGIPYVLNLDCRDGTKLFSPKT